MKRKKILSAAVVFIFVWVSFGLIGLSAEETGNNPVAVSPGSDTEVVSIWQSCPTFSWSAVEQASSYRVAVFEVVDPKVMEYESMATATTPVISKDIPGPALSWTLPAEESLKTGNMYAWYVQALDAKGNAIGKWSKGRIFKVKQEVRFVGIEEKLGEILKSYGVSEEVITGVLSDMNSQLKEVAVRDAGSNTTTKNSDNRGGVQGSESSSNTLYGLNAGASITTGVNNTFIGFYSGNKNTSGYNNSFIGNSAGNANTTGSQNSFLGSYAGFLNTTGNYNTFLGNSAGYCNTIGYLNTFLGHLAGNSNTTGSQNSFIGGFAGYLNTTGSDNIFLGYNSGYANNVGSQNSFLGAYAGRNNTSNNNTYLGHAAGYSNSTGTNNIFLGYNAGYNETGSDKLYIDNSNTSSPLIYGEFDNNILTINGKLGIGTKTPAYPMELDTTGENAAITVKRTDGVTNFISATASYAQFGAVSNHPVRILVNSTWKMMLNTNGSLSMSNGATCTTGGVWTNASSRDLKENIEDLCTDKAMEALNQLKPVTYNYKVDKADKHVGFIAEDVPELVATADRKGMSPMDVIAVLTKVVQEQQKIIADLQERMAKVEKKY